jgi:hypothetical protein
MHAAVQITLESAIVSALTTVVGTVMARIIRCITEWRSQVKTDTSLSWRSVYSSLGLLST